MPRSLIGPVCQGFNTSVAGFARRPRASRQRLLITARDICSRSACRGSCESARQDAYWLWTAVFRCLFRPGRLGARWPVSLFRAWYFKAAPYRARIQDKMVLGLFLQHRTASRHNAPDVLPGMLQRPSGLQPLMETTNVEALNELRQRAVTQQNDNQPAEIGERKRH